MKDAAAALTEVKPSAPFTDAELLSRTLALGKQSYFVLNPATGELIWPEETYRIWGLDPKTDGPITREKVIASLHPDDRTIVENSYAEPTWNDLTLEYRIVLPDGTPRYIRSVVIREREDDGEIRRVFGLLQDISEERTIAGELNTSRAFLDMAVQSTRLGVWEIDCDTREVRGNSQISTLLGYDPGELEMFNSTWDDLCHPDDRARRAAVLDKVYAGELKSYDYEYRLKGKSGQWVWVLVNGQVVEWHLDGRPKRLAGTTLDITQRKEAEDAVDAKNELLSLALQMGRLGYFHYDAGSETISWPPDTFRLWGMEPSDENPTAEWIMSNIHPEDRDMFAAQIRDPSWTEIELSFRILRPTGQILHLRSQIVRQKGPDGNVISGYGIYQDISRYHEMQNALVEGEARFRSIFETSGAGIVIADDQGTIRYINRAYADMLGYTADELVGRAFDTLSPEGEVDPVVAYAEDMRSGAQKNVSLEKRYRHRSGHSVWVRLNINVADGLGMGERMFVGVAQDITERREAEIRLKESSQLLEEAQRLGQIGHWTWIPETGAIEWSSEMYRILGLDPSQPLLQMTPFREYIHPEDRDRWDQTLDRVIQGDNSMLLEYRLIRVDGKIRHVAGRALVDQSTAGQRRLLGTVQDLTERKRTEEVLQRAIDTAESANRAKSKFLASMSHELRTPLNAILGFAQLLSLKTRGPLNDDQKGYVDNIVQGGEHLLGLINDVLDLARIDTGQLAVNIEPVDAVDVSDRVLKNFQQLAAARNIHIAFTDGIPSRLEVQADRMRLTQVLVNLTSNAIKYNREHGAVSFSISVTEDGYGRIGVSDTGRGIPDERRNEVFQSFNRLGAEASGEEGTGIGLTLSKSLVEQMNGRIGFDSRDNEGTEFWVDLPLSGESDFTIA